MAHIKEYILVIILFSVLCGLICLSIYLTLLVFKEFLTGFCEKRYLCSSKSYSVLIYILFLIVVDLIVSTIQSPCKKAICLTFSSQVCL
jgi:hypothetical protein